MFRTHQTLVTKILSFEKNIKYWKSPQSGTRAPGRVKFTCVHYMPRKRYEKYRIPIKTMKSPFLFDFSPIINAPDDGVVLDGGGGFSKLSICNGVTARLLLLDFERTFLGPFVS